MKILLVTLNDSVQDCAHTGTRWDSVVDLGWSGRETYRREGETLKCDVGSIYDLLDGEGHRRRLRDLLAVGLDQIVDSETVDWWDAFSPQVYHELERLLLLSALLEHLPKNAEIFASSPHSQLLLAESQNRTCVIQYLPRAPRAAGREPNFLGRFRNRLRTAFGNHPSRMVEIAFDKWDLDYRIRRRFAPSAKASSTPAILLPSAYVNVSRAQVAYAKLLPECRFLLVVTRHNGRLTELPENVELRTLASYAPGISRSTSDEGTRLLARWEAIRDTLAETNPLFRAANRLNCFQGFANFVKRGLGIRDAWRETLSREPISAVLSGDENNPYTRIPIWLAKARKMPTVFCDHGALNMSFGIRRPISDTYIAQGDMARDYFVSSCGLCAERIVVGAPRQHPSLSSSQNTRDRIVFYSEPYELSSGRTQALYAELLPELCSIAQRTNRKVIIKLHPFESLRLRQRLVNKVLSAEHRSSCELREGPITPELFARAWCSFTVESSVAVESTMNGVPCFLCSWFDSSWYGYGRQYAKYSAGIPLDSSQRIREVPQLLAKVEITEGTRDRLETPISPEELESVLSGGRTATPNDPA
jgi:hypothetical protein